MPIINVAIGKSKYQLDCPVGEEEKIYKLASRLNERVNRLSLSLRVVDEKTILMLCAIMMEEEILNHSEFNSTATPPFDQSIFQDLENIISHIETLANKVKNS